jgi:lysophospholipase
VASKVGSGSIKRAKPAATKPAAAKPTARKPATQGPKLLTAAEQAKLTPVALAKAVVEGKARPGAVQMRRLAEALLGKAEAPADKAAPVAPNAEKPAKPAKKDKKGGKKKARKAKNKKLPKIPKLKK